MTQLYSNLVNHMNNTTYLCLVLAVPCSLVVLRVRLTSLHTGQPQWILLGLLSHVQLSKCSPFIFIVENKGGPTHGFKKQRIYSAQQKYELPGLKEDASG